MEKVTSEVKFLIGFLGISSKIAISAKKEPQIRNQQVEIHKISELYSWAKRLQRSCPNIKYLSLMGNPVAPSYLNGGSFYEYVQYRFFIVSLFPKLIHLDDKVVTPDQRREAQKMHHRPLVERLVCKTHQNLPTYLRVVSERVSEILSPNPTTTQKNSII